jgi:hypothetical protein
MRPRLITKSSTFGESFAVTLSHKKQTSPTITLKYSPISEKLSLFDRLLRLEMKLQECCHSPMANVGTGLGNERRLILREHSEAEAEAEVQSVCFEEGMCEFGETCCGFAITVLKHYDAKVECIFSIFPALWFSSRPFPPSIVRSNVDFEYFYLNEVIVSIFSSICFAALNDKRNASLSNPHLLDCHCLFEVNIILDSDDGGCDREIDSNQKEGEMSDNFLRSEVDCFRHFLQLSGGSDEDSSSAFFSRMSAEPITVDRSVERIEKNDFYGLQSTPRFFFVADSVVRYIDDFEKCTSLYRIDLPSSVEVIDAHGFFGCTSLSEIIFSSDSHV